MNERKIVMVSGFDFCWFYHADVVDMKYMELCNLPQKELDRNTKLMIVKEDLTEWKYVRDEQK